MKADSDASRKRFTNISSYEYDLREFNMMIGTPIWTWTITPTILTYIVQNKNMLKDKELGFFCTMGGNGNKQAFAEIKKYWENLVRS